MTETAIEQQNADERLKDVFRRLMELYERHAQERQLLIKEKEELNRLVQLLVSQTKEIGQYENGIRKRIQDCIQESANVAMNNLERIIADKTNQSNEECIKKIAHVCESMQSITSTFHSEKKKYFWRIIVVAILGGILSSFLMTWILIPKPTLPLTAEQMNYLQAGRMLLQIWPRLTIQERNRLKTLSSELINKENLM